MKKPPRTYIVKRIKTKTGKGKSKKYLFSVDGNKRIGSIDQDWVKVGDIFSEQEIRVEGLAVGFRPGWHSLSLDNDFVKDKNWAKYRVLIKCPTCKKFTH